MSNPQRHPVHLAHTTPEPISASQAAIALGQIAEQKAQNVVRHLYNMLATLSARPQDAHLEIKPLIENLAAFGFSRQMANNLIDELRGKGVNLRTPSMAEAIGMLLEVQGDNGLLFGAKMAQWEPQLDPTNGPPTGMLEYLLDMMADISQEYRKALEQRQSQAMLTSVGDIFRLDAEAFAAYAAAITALITTIHYMCIWGGVAMKTREYAGRVLPIPINSRWGPRLLIYLIFGAMILAIVATGAQLYELGQLSDPLKILDYYSRARVWGTLNAEGGLDDAQSLVSQDILPYMTGAIGGIYDSAMGRLMSSPTLGISGLISSPGLTLSVVTHGAVQQVISQAVGAGVIPGLPDVPLPVTMLSQLLGLAILREKETPAEKRYEIIEIFKDMGAEALAAAKLLGWSHADRKLEFELPDPSTGTITKVTTITYKLLIGAIRTYLRGSLLFSAMGTPYVIGIQGSAIPGASSLAMAHGFAVTVGLLSQMDALSLFYSAITTPSGPEAGSVTLSFARNALVMAGMIRTGFNASLRIGSVTTAPQLLEDMGNSKAQKMAEADQVDDLLMALNEGNPVILPGNEWANNALAVLGDHGRTDVGLVASTFDISALNKPEEYRDVIGDFWKTLPAERSGNQKMAMAS